MHGRRRRLAIGLLMMLWVAVGSFGAPALATDPPATQPLRRLVGHAAALRGVAFSPDGKILAAVGLDGTVRLWDPISGKETSVLVARPTEDAAPNSVRRNSGVDCLAFTPDGKGLATGSVDGSVTVWDPAQAKVLHLLTGHTARVRCLAISPSGKILASGSDDRTVRLWDVDSGASKVTLTGHTLAVKSVAFDAAGQVVSGSWDASMRRWDTDSGKQLAVFSMDLAVLALASTPTKFLAAGHALGPISLWDCSGEWTRRTLAGHGSNVSAVAFAGDGKVLASAGMDGAIALWEVATGRRLRTLVHAPSSAVWSIAFSPDGRTLASVGEDPEVTLWDARCGNLPMAVPNDVPREPPRAAQPQPGETETVAAIKRLGGRFLVQGSKASWSPDGGRIVFGDRSGGLTILDCRTGKTSSLTTPGRDPAWSPSDGRHVAYVRPGAAGAEIALVEAAGGRPRSLAPGSCPSWSADRKTLFFYSAANSKLQSLPIDVKNPSAIDVLGSVGSCPAVAGDGKRVAYPSGRQLRIVATETGRTLSTWPLSSNDVYLAGWSPDGQHLAFGEQASDAWTGLWVVDVAKNQGVRVTLGPLAMPVWSRDGSKLAFDVRLRNESEIWMIETKNLSELKPQVPAAGRCTVPELADQVIGPLHHPKGKLVSVDFARQANFKLAQGTTEGNHLAELSRGEQELAGVKFRIGDAGIHLGSKRLSTMPSRVEGIRIDRRVIHLYVLHATQWGVPEFSVMDGMTVGCYRVRYADGSAVTIPIVCGVDVRDWWSRSERPVARGQIAWAGGNPAASHDKFSIRLYLAAWENPHPERSVASIDYISTMTDAAPFCVAMTTEDPAPARLVPRAAITER